MIYYDDVYTTNDIKKGDILAEIIFEFRVKVGFNNIVVIGAIEGHQGSSSSPKAFYCSVTASMIDCHNMVVGCWDIYESKKAAKRFICYDVLESLKESIKWDVHL